MALSYVAEYAANGRAKCKEPKCKGTLAKGELRSVSVGGFDVTLTDVAAAWARKSTTHSARSDLRLELRDPSALSNCRVIPPTTGITRDACSRTCHACARIRSASRLKMTSLVSARWIA